MDKINSILYETEGGLNVILHYYPQARKCIENKRAKFKIRNEKTPSASIYQDKGKWYLKDFGNGDKRKDAFALVMEHENLSFNESLDFILNKFCNIQYNKQTKPAEMPVFKKISKSIKDDVVFNDQLSEFELKAIGKKVTQEICDLYKLKSVKYFIRKDSIYEIWSTDKFPILCFDFGDWKKIYQPLNADKAFRFSYIGNKPKDFIFGLDQIKEKYEAAKKVHMKESNKESEEINSESLNEDDILDHSIKSDIFICSGDRDALNVASTGKNVIWFNSETAVLSTKQYYELKELSNDIFVIPDIDKTGEKQGNNLCLKFQNIKKIVLPKELKNYTDFRGNRCKDVTDFFEHSYKIGVSFEKLIRNAVSYKFWEPLLTKNGEFKGYMINTVSLLLFLEANGYFRKNDHGNEYGYVYVKIENNIVRRILPKSSTKGVGGIKIEIKDFINSVVQFESPLLRNKLFKSKDTDESIISNLNFIEDLDFKSYDKDYMYMVFPNVAWKITKDSIDENNIKDIEKYFWKDDIKVKCKHVTKLEKPIFEIDYSDEFNKVIELGDPKQIDNFPDIDRYTIKINDPDFIFLKFLKNASRIYWEKEESGEKLTEIEKKEELLHLINKIYALGYLSFRFKDPNKPWAVFVMDAKETDLGKSFGGSGKSLFLQSLNHINKTFHIPGRDPEKTKNRFIFDGIDEYTFLININDADQYFKFDFFFTFITDDMRVEGKNKSAINIMYENSPKIAISSNYSLRNIDPSTKRRLLYVAFSDYYHEKDDDGMYQKKMSPAEEFEKKLFLEFTDDEWNKFYNFIASAIQTFLKIDTKIEPPMESIYKKNLKTQIGQDLFEWASDYFSDSLRLNTFIEKRVIFESIKESIPFTNNFSSQVLKKKIDAFCRYMGWELNPKNMLANGSQISKNSTEYLYIKTIKDDEYLKEADEWLEQNKEDPS